MDRLVTDPGEIRGWVLLEEVANPECICKVCFEYPHIGYSHSHGVKVKTHRLGRCQRCIEEGRGMK